jgi:ribosomal protein S18 acetylase RimI-like enzyme
MWEAFMNTNQLAKLLKDPVLLKSFNSLVNDHGNFQSNEGYFSLDNVIADCLTEERTIVYYIIWTDDKIIFTSRMFCAPVEGFITMVHTHDDYKRQGVCSTAFKKIFKHLAEIKRWKLDVEKENKAAIACYQKLGFKPTILQPYADAILMSFTSS